MIYLQKILKTKLIKTKNKLFKISIIKTFKKHKETGNKIFY